MTRHHAEMTGWCQQPKRWLGREDGYQPRDISRDEYHALDGHERCERHGAMVGKPNGTDPAPEPCLCPCHALDPEEVENAVASLRALERTLQNQTEA